MLHIYITISKHHPKFPLDWRGVLMGNSWKKDFSRGRDQNAYGTIQILRHHGILERTVLKSWQVDCSFRKANGLHQRFEKDIASHEL